MPLLDPICLSPEGAVSHDVRQPLSACLAASPPVFFEEKMILPSQYDKDRKKDAL